MYVEQSIKLLKNIKKKREEKEKKKKEKRGKKRKKEGEKKLNTYYLYIHTHTQAHLKKPHTEIRASLLINTVTAGKAENTK